MLCYAAEPPRAPFKAPPKTPPRRALEALPPRQAPPPALHRRQAPPAQHRQHPPWLKHVRPQSPTTSRGKAWAKICPTRTSTVRLVPCFRSAFVTTVRARLASLSRCSCCGVPHLAHPQVTPLTVDTTPRHALVALLQMTIRRSRHGLRLHHGQSLRRCENES